MSFSRALALVLAVAAFGGIRARAWAQDINSAETLPQGVGVFSISPTFGFGTERFGRNFNAERESIVRDFNGIDLTEIFLGTGGRDLNTRFGTTSFDGDQNAIGFNFALAYGITHRLTFAALLAYNTIHTKVDAAIIPDPDPDRRANIMVKSGLECPQGLGGEIDIQQFITDPGDSRYVLNVADVDRLATSPCFQYRAVTDRIEVQNGVPHGIAERSFTGINDLVLALRYKIWNGEVVRLALTQWTIAPTGRPDDPDDLFDTQFSDGRGQWDTALVGNLELALGKLRVATSGGFEVQWADTQTKRIFNITFSDEQEERLARGEITEQELLDGDLDEAFLVPLAPWYDRVEIERKLGNNLYAYLSASYEIFPWLYTGISVDFLHHFRDEATKLGPHPDGTGWKTADELRAEMLAKPEYQAATEAGKLSMMRGALANSAGRRAASLAWRTVRQQVAAAAGLAINTLPWVQSGAFPVPLIIGLSGKGVFAGRNIEAPWSFSTSLTIPFAFGEIPDLEKYAPDGAEGDKRSPLPYP